MLSPARTRALAKRALAPALALSAAACGGSQILGADPSGACPPGMRPHRSEAGSAECVSAAAADFALCTRELGLAAPRPAVSVSAVMTFPHADVAPSASVSVSGHSNGQIYAQPDPETDKARAEALRACTRALERAADAGAAAAPARPVSQRARD